MDAENAVSNFIELTEQGFFNADAETEKQMTFYQKVGDMALITGSPTNDPRGGPDYRLASERKDSTKKHKKGTLTMLLEQDPVSGNPVPDTAGSQFMICLKDMPSWDGMYIPFGQITSGLEVLDKIAEGDAIESISVIEKRNRPYYTRKLPRKK